MKNLRWRDDGQIQSREDFIVQKTLIKKLHLSSFKNIIELESGTSNFKKYNFQFNLTK